MIDNVYDAIIIGAGAAGLVAAWELSSAGKKVCVVEAQDRIGGRIHTVNDPSFQTPVEMGAEFVHGDLPFTKHWLKKAGLKAYTVKGDVWRKENHSFEKQEDFIEDYSALEKKFKELNEDIPVAQFINEHLQDENWHDLRFSLKSYVEGYYAADADKASTYALCKELTQPDEEQFRIDKGYGPLLEYIKTECIKNGCFFMLSSPVHSVQWRKGEVKLQVAGKEITGSKLLTTASIGILRSGTIQFSPALNEKQEALKHLGFGSVIKFIFQFSDIFWRDKQFTQNKDLSDVGFLFTEESVPTWWTHYPKKEAVLTGWLAGPRAERLASHTDEELLQTATASLSSIFNMDAVHLQQRIVAAHVANWLNQKYVGGGYSYEVVNGANHQQTLKTPEEDTLYFAGEGLIEGPQIGTVEAAFQSGQETARLMISHY